MNVEDIEEALNPQPSEADKEALAEKRRQGAVKAEEKRKKEQDERERRIADEAAERATAAALKAFQAQLTATQAPTPKVVQKSASDYLPEDFKTTYTDVANGFTPALDAVFGVAQSSSDRLAELEKQFASMNGKIAEASTASKLDDDSDFQNFLNGETDAGVSRKNALEHWKNADINRYRQLKSKYEDQFRKESGNTTIDEFAQPTTTQSPAVPQAKKADLGEVLTKINRSIEAELGKGPMSNRGRVEKLTEARAWFQAGDTERGLEIIKSLKG
jgi:hypothetical protein